MTPKTSLVNTCPDCGKTLEYIGTRSSGSPDGYFFEAYMMLRCVGCGRVEERDVS